MKSLIIILALIMTATSTGTDSSSVDQMLRQAVTVWEDYIEAVRAGDRERAIGYWSEGTRRRYPFFDWQMPYFGEAVDIVRNTGLEITDIRKHEDHIELAVASSDREYTYYLIRERGRTLLANPVEVLTRGWERKEKKNLVLHYRKGSGPTPLQFGMLDRFCSETSSSLGLPVERKIDYYKCDSSGEVGRLFGQAPAVGLGHHLHYAVAAVSWSSFHEVVHVLLGQVSRKKPTSLILEGSACWLGGTGLVTREAQLSWARSLVENEEHLPITLISEKDGFWSAEDMNDPYAEAGAFNRFLAERYGIGRFKELYGYRDTEDDLESEVTRIYGRDIAGLEYEWKEWLLKLDLPSIETGGGEDCEEIFSMEDPAFDDKGDGDYTYPLDPRYNPGIFDLTGFVVLKGNERIWFKLRYRALAVWEGSTEWGFGGTYTRIAIDCGENSGGSFGRDARATLSGSCDCLINISDCGIILWRRGRIAGILKRAPRGMKLGDAENGTIFFSVPVSMIGEPREDWRYTVAVGGCCRGGRRLFDGTGLLVDVGESPSAEAGGGGLDAGINPNIYDILLPEGRDQVKILGDYDPETGRIVSLPMIRQ